MMQPVGVLANLRKHTDDWSGKQSILGFIDEVLELQLLLSALLSLCAPAWFAVLVAPLNEGNGQQKQRNEGAEREEEQHSVLFGGRLWVHLVLEVQVS